jgi:protein-L-isoaspartate O-methyltransferase
VTVISGDGGSALSESVDRVYVNFGVAAPMAIDNLKPGGKLLFALGVPIQMCVRSFHGIRRAQPRF